MILKSSSNCEQAIVTKTTETLYVIQVNALARVTIM